jgi:hypothetical protein
MSQQKIRAALETAFAAWATTNTVAVAWQNKPYTPVTGTKYCRPYLLPATTQNPSLGDAHKRMIGIFQVSLYLKLGDGPGAAETLADSLCSTFARGNGFTASGVTVRILESPSIRPAFNDEGWYVVPVDIPYQADIY